MLTLLASHIERAGGSARIELSGRDPAGSRKRPDIDALVGSESFLIDVTIREAFAQSYGGSLESAFEAARAAKMRTYADMAEQLGAKVVPFIVDAFGAFDEKAIDFVNQLADFASEAIRAESPVRLTSRILDSISAAVQRGNARMIARGAIWNLRDFPHLRPPLQHALPAQLLPPS